MEDAREARRKRLAERKTDRIGQSRSPALSAPQDDKHPATDFVQTSSDFHFLASRSAFSTLNDRSFVNKEEQSCNLSEKHYPISSEIEKILKEFPDATRSFLDNLTSVIMGESSVIMEETNTLKSPLSEKTSIPDEQTKFKNVGLKEAFVEECLDFLNNASKEELMQLKWIGEIRADYILKLREKGPKPFKNIQDLIEMGLSSKQIIGLMTKLFFDIKWNF